MDSVLHSLSGLLTSSFTFLLAFTLSFIPLMSERTHVLLLGLQLLLKSTMTDKKVRVWSDEIQKSRIHQCEFGKKEEGGEIYDCARRHSTDPQKNRTHPPNPAPIFRLFSQTGPDFLWNWIPNHTFWGCIFWERNYLVKRIRLEKDLWPCYILCWQTLCSFSSFSDSRWKKREKGK